MPIPQELLRKQHACKIDEIIDTTSQYGYEFQCLCGLHGLFVLEDDAKAYQATHMNTVGVQGTPEYLKTLTDMERSGAAKEMAPAAPAAKPSAKSSS